MGRALFGSSVVRHLNVLALAGLVAVTAFAAGRARAASGDGPRRETEVVQAVRHAAPAVVSVFSVKRGGRNTWIQSAGSGVIVHPAGYVVTNSHVIRGGNTVHVERFNGGGRYRAEVVANLPGNDLALLRIQGHERFPYVSIVRSRAAMLGETVIAIGNPRGLGDTITVGVVSALGRDAKLSGGATLRDLIQTDASINSGNSGGGLLNLDGELLGVVVSIMPRATGIAFAIPGEQVRTLLQRALGGAPAAKPLPVPRPTPTPSTRRPGIASSTREETGLRRGGLPPPAVAGRGRTSAIRTTPLRPEDYGMTLRDTGSFMQVWRVARGGPADLAGVQVGDAILNIDGRPVENELDLTLAFSAARPGRIYQLHVRRAGEERHAALITPR